MNPFVQQLLNAARNTAARAAKGFVVQADRNAGPQVRRALGSGYLNRYSNPIFSATKKDPSLINAAVKGSLSVPGAKPILAMPVGLLALDPRLPGAIELFQGREQQHMAVQMLLITGRPMQAQKHLDWEPQAHHCEIMAPDIKSVN
jgi:hypothetical protein